MLDCLLDLFLPRRCHICGESLAEGEEILCAKCRLRLPRTLYHRTPDNPVELRFAGFFPFERATAHFFYSRGSDIAEIIHDFKYRKFPTLGIWLGKLMATELLPTGFFSDVDTVIPVPMHWTKRLKRGYNQTEMLAKGLAEILKIEIAGNLVAGKPHKSQTSLSGEQRCNNINGIFKVRNPDKLTRRHILLIDDVCTTGATLRNAAVTLLDANPAIRLTLLAVCTPE